MGLVSAHSGKERRFFLSLLPVLERAQRVGGEIESSWSFFAVPDLWIHHVESEPIALKAEDYSIGDDLFNLQTRRQFLVFVEEVIVD
jgi:hypothetical protein